MKKTAIILILTTLILGCKSQNKKDIDLEAIHQKNLKDSTLVTGWYYITIDSSGFARQLSKTDEIYYIDPKPITVAKNIEDIELGINYVRDIYIGMQFDKQGTESWYIATKKSIGNQLAFIVDNELLTIPTVNNYIEGGKSAFGRKDYTKQEYEILVEEIKKEMLE